MGANTYRGVPNKRQVLPRARLLGPAAWKCMVVARWNPGGDELDEAVVLWGDQFEVFRLR